MRLEKKIVVAPSELSIPNVFTPNGDGINDNFMVEAKSLKNISVEVYSRSGLKVYSFLGDGETLREWKGWDGNVNSSSSKAAPGVYFYIIRAYGWDDVIYDSKEYRGFVYLYR
jgi:gliding motility-associated-like protein